MYESSKYTPPKRWTVSSTHVPVHMHGNTRKHKNSVQTCQAGWCEIFPCIVVVTKCFRSLAVYKVATSGVLSVSIYMCSNTPDLLISFMCKERLTGTLGGTLWLVWMLTQLPMYKQLSWYSISDISKSTKVMSLKILLKRQEATVYTLLLLCPHSSQVKRTMFKCKQVTIVHSGSYRLLGALW